MSVKSEYIPIPVRVTDKTDNEELKGSIPPDNEKEMKKLLNSENDIDEGKVRSIEINRILNEMPLSEDTICGYWIFKGPLLQRYASKNMFVCLYGLFGCIFGMTFAYFGGTITTIEKRFKIPSRNTGIICCGYDISQMLLCGWLSYYAGKGHRPQWIGFGVLTIWAFCILTVLPHILFGPGEDALALTVEFGAVLNENATNEAQQAERSKVMCTNIESGCQEDEGNLAPQLFFFMAHIISGIGGSLYYSLGTTYMDDNTPKDQTPMLLSYSYFLRTLGPAMGFALASLCLKYYIAPNLTPVITSDDPRWIGAWWLGWLIFAILILVFGFFLSLFPKELPKTAARRAYDMEKNRMKLINVKDEEILEKQPEHASFEDMKATLLRLIRNRTFMYNNYAAIFYIFGYMPYWIFASKYIEIQYRQTASTSNMVTGTVALGFSALGILAAGIVISKFKPRSRYMAGWNVIIGILTVFGMLSYLLMGCPENENSLIVNIPVNNSVTCNSACNCDYVPYAPVCSDNGYSFISACHAGCRDVTVKDGQYIYYDCSCIAESKNNFKPDDLLLLQKPKFNYSYSPLDAKTNRTSLLTYLNSATPGSCPVDCTQQFMIFLTVMCLLKFIGATGRATNFLISIRCVDDKDKAASIGFGMVMISLLAFIPSPIIFGWVMDSFCLVWGKTCSHSGNCWLYDTESLRLYINLLAAFFIAIGSIFDSFVWYHVKHVQIFDDETKETGRQLNDINKSEPKDAKLETN